MSKKKHKTHKPRWLCSYEKRVAHKYEKAPEAVDRLDSMSVTRQDMMPEITRKGKTKLGQVGERYRVYGQDLFGHHELRKHGNRWKHYHNGSLVGEVQIDKPIRDAMVHLTGESAFDLSSRDKLVETDVSDTVYLYPDGRSRSIPTVRVVQQAGEYESHTEQQPVKGGYVATKPRRAIEDVVSGFTPTKPIGSGLRVTIREIDQNNHVVIAPILPDEIQAKLDTNPLPE